MRVGERIWKEALLTHRMHHRSNSLGGGGGVQNTNTIKVRADSARPKFEPPSSGSKSYMYCFNIGLAAVKRGRRSYIINGLPSGTGLLVA